MVPLFYCLAAFTMVYVVFDLFNNLTDFIQGKAPVASVVRFYLMIIPASLIYIMPASLMLAELYCLSILTKNNELTAMRACGVSLFRLMTPFMAVGIGASIFVAAVNETIGPYAAYWTRQFVRQQKQQDKMKIFLYDHLPYHNHLGHRTWMIGQFNAKTYDLQRLEVIQHDENNMDLYKVTAAAGRWLGGRWWFEDLTIQYYDEYGSPRGPPRPEPTREMSEYDETPEDLLNEIKDPEFLSAADLVKFIRSHTQLSHERINRTLVDLHSRLALPWACLVVTLLGIPFGNQTGRKGAFLGVVLCIALFFSSWVLISFGLWAGKKGLIEPWIAGWGPILFFLGLGLTLSFRIR